MATTYDYVDKSTGSDYYGAGVPVSRTGRRFCVKRSINLATAGDTLTTTGAFGAADVLQVFNVTEGMLIEGVAIEVTTAEGATQVSDVGDGGDANGYLMAANFNSTGWYTADGTYGGKYVGEDTPTYQNGKLYTTADTIDITLTTAAADTAVFDVYIWGMDLGPVS